jgi:hypothetical protein
MARVPITAVTIPDTGYNVTDSVDFETMVSGANNGVTLPHNSAARIVLYNSTGGALTYTLKVPTPAAYTAIGVTFDDVDVTVAAGDMWELKQNSLFRQSDGNIYIDCSGAGKILVLA